MTRRASNRPRPSAVRCTRTTACLYCGASFQGTPAAVDARVRLHCAAEHPRSADAPEKLHTGDVLATIEARLRANQHVEEHTSAVRVGFSSNGAACPAANMVPLARVRP